MIRGILLQTMFSMRNSNVVTIGYELRECENHFTAARAGANSCALDLQDYYESFIALRCFWQCDHRLCIFSPSDVVVGFAGTMIAIIL